MGWTLAGSQFNGSGDRIGTAMTHHYTMTTHGHTARGVQQNPITHHLVVDEFGNQPGKYNVEYHVTQGGHPYGDGEFDTLRRHVANARGGAKDPLGELLGHHQTVSRILSHRMVPQSGQMTRVNPGTLHRLTPQKPYHAEPGWGSDPKMKGTQRITPGPDYGQAGMIHLNAMDPAPLDMRVHRLLTGGGKGREQFEYQGRLFPDDEHQPTDLYRAEYQDPRDPTMNYGFTIRHMPSAQPEEDDQVGTEVTPGVQIDPILTPRARVFSYNMNHYPAGSDEVGEFGDVSGEGSPVANFTDVGPLLERHLNVLRGLGLRPIPPPPPRPQYGASTKQGTGPVSDEDWESFVGGRNPIQGMMPDGTPVVDHFDPNFGHDEPNPLLGGRRRVYERHAVANGSAGEPEVYEPRGNCVTCGRPTWNTPGGGEAPNWEDTGNAHYAEEYGMHGPDVAQCANCANDYDTYKEAIRAGERPGGLWHHPGARINNCDQCASEAGE
jgi:hypothetical protein